MIIALNKPYDVLSQFTSADGAPTLGQYVSMPDVYAAGRLDKDSEGLLLLTDEPKIARRLTDPRHELPKTYWVQVEREPHEDALELLRTGVEIEGRMTRPAEVRRIAEPELWERPVPVRFRKTVPTCWLEIVLREGRNRQIRKMTAAVGHPCLRIVRVAVGSVTLGGLAPGDWREVVGAEAAALRTMPPPGGGGRLTRTRRA